MTHGLNKATKSPVWPSWDSSLPVSSQLLFLSLRPCGNPQALVSTHIYRMNEMTHSGSEKNRPGTLLWLCELGQVTSLSGLVKQGSEQYIITALVAVRSFCRVLDKADAQLTAWASPSRHAWCLPWRWECGGWRGLYYYPAWTWPTSYSAVLLAPHWEPSLRAQEM